MRVKEMHPLCCITLETHVAGAAGAGDASPEPILLRTGSAVNLFDSGSDPAANSDAGATTVAGILYKWTNYGKGWRSRWFTLRDNGVLSYSKTSRRRSAAALPAAAAADLRRKHAKTAGIVHLKISSFRESKSDDRRFYIFTATKTLHLRTNSKKERAAWIEALISTRSLFSLRPQTDEENPLLTRNLSISTDRLKHRLLDEGVDEEVVKDCEQIMLSEFSGIQGQYRALCQERSNLLDTLKQLEAANIEGETSGINDGEFQLMKHGYTNVARGKYGEWSTTESSDEIEKQELEEASDSEETHFFDTNECFPDPGSAVVNCMDSCQKLESPSNESKRIDAYPCIKRRTKLPDPVEKEKGVSLWSMIKDNIGKDLTRVCLPVYFNEPISSLQKCFEELEYSHLLDQAYEHGKMGNGLMRILNVAAFAVSGYASSEGRHCKPFNPLLGETYEADYPEKGLRFFAEKVSHHPTLIACHCEGKGWKFWCDTNLKSKFWGRSIQVDPVGTLNLEFDDGEVFQWSKVTTSINNLILGTIYCHHHGTMHIRGNRQYSCKLKFKELSILERNPRQVNGFVEDEMGHKVAQLFGKWDESMYFVHGEGTSGAKDGPEASILWKRNMPPVNLTRYNLTSFAITLNELVPGLKEKLPPTDSRLRPDQRFLENGEFEKANEEKLRLETRQRMSRKLQEDGWKPRWFRRDGEGPFYYIGGYWEAREQGKWDGCPDIFGEILQCS
ncbi:oxysterol-binding protein-related protein 2A-like [Andrographis paniculata]|uniref:oxysterol-binding protein-related protein 2A-like n=1 Tax=Andrographis paniculata TaxID=175694 RepID=UPI0021E97E00|nr:oxysterol-binding protein-related protein 2A-like [Andrographis paniculata]